MNKVSVVNILYTFICMLYFVIAKPNEATQTQLKDGFGTWKIKYTENVMEQFVKIEKIKNISLTIYDVELNNLKNYYFEIQATDPKVITVSKRVDKQEFNGISATWNGEVQVKPHQIGHTRLYITLHTDDGVIEKSLQGLDVTVMQENNKNQIFTYTASALVLLMFINLGTVLDLKRLKDIIVRPISVTIGFCSRIILLPAAGLLIGYSFLEDNKEQQLALFLTALSPSGGLANICNIFLKGNINLSVAITTINSLLALAMFPLWIYFLSCVNYGFDDILISIPFIELAIGLITLILALIVGCVLRILIPKTTYFIFKFLKPLCVFLSLCLVGVTVGINASAFKEITALMFMATFFLPIIAYLISFGLSKLFCRSSTDSLTVAIETGVLNMTIPIVILQYGLDTTQPDEAIAVPMLAALLSLGIIIILYIVRRILGWNKKLDEDGYDSKLFIAEEQKNSTG